MKLEKTLFVAVLACAVSFGLQAGSPVGVQVNGVDVGTTSKGDGWNYDSAHRINIKGANKTYRITGKDVDNLGIRVKIEAPCKVEIRDLELPVRSSPNRGEGNNALWLDASKKIEATLDFSGKNVLGGGDRAAGIGVKPGQKLTIVSSDASAVLTAEGGVAGAGIGGNGEDGSASCCGTVVIDVGRDPRGSAKIVAKGGWGGAGIGGAGCGGNPDHFQDVYISNFAGGQGGDVTIRSGVVEATGGSNNGWVPDGGGAGIGGGCFVSRADRSKCGRGGQLVVEGGRVIARGAFFAAGIGGAYHGSMGRVTIHEGAVVEAHGGFQAAGIGSGAETPNNDDFVFVMQGGRVSAHREEGDYPSFARGESQPMDIGGGIDSGCGWIFIENGTLEADMIGMVDMADGYHVRINGGSAPLSHWHRKSFYRSAAAGNQFVHAVRLKQDEWAGKRLEVLGLGRYGVKEIYGNDRGEICLWLPTGDYYVAVDGLRIPFRVEDDGSVIEIPWTEETIDVVWDPMGGQVIVWEPDGHVSWWDEYVMKIEKGSVVHAKDVPSAYREGYRFLGWSCSSDVKYDKTPILVTGIHYWAQWEKLPEDAFDDDDDSGLVSAAKSVTVSFNAIGGSVAGETGDTFERQYSCGQQFGAFPVPVRSGWLFTGWYCSLFVEPLLATDRVWGDLSVWAGWEKAPASPRKTVTFYRCLGEAPNGLGPTNSAGYEDIDQIESLYQPYTPPARPGYTFLGWFTQPVGGREYPKYERVTTYEDESYYAHWKKDGTVWTQNRYHYAPLSGLGVEMPDPSTVKAVKPEWLPSGLRIVQDKATTTWYLEGVPAQEVDGSTLEAAIRIQYKAKGSADTIAKLDLVVVADEHPFRLARLDHIFSEKACDLFDVSAASTWSSMTGQPDGIAWNKGDASFYGDPKAIGFYTAVGKRSVVGAVDGKTKFSEVYTADFEVRPESGDYESDHKISLELNVDCTVDLTETFAMANDKGTTATLKIPGLKFTAKPTGGVPAGSLYGKPTQAGQYPLTLKDKYKKEAYYLVTVLDPSKDVPHTHVNLGTKPVLLRKKVQTGDEVAEKSGSYTLMLGASVNFPVTTAVGAALKAAGLPTGLKLAQEKSTGTWTISGTPTKAGSFFTALTTTRNKIASVQTISFEVVPNAFEGEFRGFVKSFTHGTEPILGLVTVSVAAGGSVKVTLAEHGKTVYTYSAKNFIWDDLDGSARLEFDVPPTADQKKKGAPTRSFSLAIIDRDGGFKAVSGTVANLEPDGTRRETDSFQAWPVVSADELNAHGLFTRAQPTTWYFDDEEAGSPIALVSVCPNMSTTAFDGVIKGDAKGQVKFADGTQVKLAKLPIVRVGTDAADPKSYVYAPFAVQGAKAKGSPTYVFNGLTANSSMPFLDGVFPASGTMAYEDPESSRVQERPASLAAPYRWLDEVLECHLTRYSTLVCDFGLDGMEVFSCVATGLKDAHYEKMEVHDTQNDLLATWSSKFVRETGVASVKFTSKDKVHSYAVDFFVHEFGGDADYVKDVYGLVTDVWKDGKTTKTRVGFAQIFISE